MESWEQAVIWVGYNSGFYLAASIRAVACFMCHILGFLLRFHMRGIRFSDLKNGVKLLS